MARRGRDGILRTGRPLDWPYHKSSGWAPTCQHCEVLKRPFYYKSVDCTLSVEERAEANHVLEERKK